MLDASKFSDPERAHSARIAKLLAAVPVQQRQPIAVMLPACSRWAAVTAAAVQQAQRPLVLLPGDADTAQLAQAIAQHQPGVLVCDTAVFGWASKLAFTQGVTAVFTCDSEGQGTLLDRAAHC